MKPVHQRAEFIRPVRAAARFIKLDDYYQPITSCLRDGLGLAAVQGAGPGLSTYC